MTYTFTKDYVNQLINVTDTSTYADRSAVAVVILVDELTLVTNADPVTDSTWEVPLQASEVFKVSLCQYTNTDDPASDGVTDGATYYATTEGVFKTYNASGDDEEIMVPVYADATDKVDVNILGDFLLYTQLMVLRKAWIESGAKNNASKDTLLLHHKALVATRGRFEIGDFNRAEYYMSEILNS